MEQLYEVAAQDNLINQHELERAILVNIFQGRRASFIRSTRYGRLDLNTFTDEECFLHFRFHKRDLQRLVCSLGIPLEVRMPQSFSVSGIEGLCILLRRLSYPNRYSDLESMFGLSRESLSIVSNEIMNIVITNKGHLLNNLVNINFLNQERLRNYAISVANKGAPLVNCWGFIDGTCRAVCRPKRDQEEYFSGHKRHHCVKYQSVLCPDGIVVSLKGPYTGRRHDAGILRESNLYEELEQVASFNDNEKYCLYGDCAYPIRELLLCPFPAGRGLTPEQQLFNASMSRVRQAVEWGFGKIAAEFAFVDFKKNQKILLQNIGNMYKTAAILSNCHTCLYGCQTSTYFETNPPNLDEYLGN